MPIEQMTEWRFRHRRTQRPLWPTIPHIYRIEGCWAVALRDRGGIWRNTQDFRVVAEGVKHWERLINAN